MKPLNIIDDSVTDDWTPAAVHPTPNVTHAQERKPIQTSAYEPGKGYFTPQYMGVPKW